MRVMSLFCSHSPASIQYLLCPLVKKRFGLFLIIGQVFKMSIAKAAAKAMLSDALLQDGPGINRISHLELELPLDKVIKFVTVGLPLMLVCLAFAREISLGEQLFVSVLEYSTFFD